MYAVFATGGKQYRATTGDILKIEKLNAEKGAMVELDQVLMVGEGENIKVGSPYLQGGKVTAKVVEHGRGEKIRVIKFHRRKNYRKQMGHRQDFTRIEITGIAAPAAEEKVTEAKTARTKVTKAKTTKSKVTKAKITKSKVTKAKVTKAKTAKTKVAKAKTAKTKVAKAKTAKVKAEAASAKDKD